jgi:hypothetical protein
MPVRKCPPAFAGYPSIGPTSRSEIDSSRSRANFSTLLGQVTSTSSLTDLPSPNYRVNAHLPLVNAPSTKLDTRVRILGPLSPSSVVLSYSGFLHKRIASTYESLYSPFPSFVHPAIFFLLPYHWSGGRVLPTSTEQRVNTPPLVLWP